MITTKTCLILGAGASAPYRLPTAIGLRDLILSTRAVRGPETALQFPLLQPDGGIRDFLRDPNLSAEKRPMRAATAWVDHLQKACLNAGFSDVEIAEFRNIFFRARRQSIDKFIQYNEKAFGRIGRIHIAAVLLNCERDAWLDGDWYSLLLDAIVPNHPSDLKRQTLSVVSFNYDRSFEHFFRTAFEAGFHLSAEQAKTMFQRIKIAHVYGHLGSLDQLPYGDTRFFIQAAQRINFIRDASKQECREEINQLVADANSICFIGFAFAPENLDLFEKRHFKGKPIVATVAGLPPTRLQEVKKAIPNIRFFDGTAAELLRTQNIFTRRKGVVERDFVPVKRRTSNWVLGDTAWRI